MLPAMIGVGAAVCNGFILFQVNILDMSGVSAAGPPAFRCAAMVSFRRDRIRWSFRSAGKCLTDFGDG